MRFINTMHVCVSGCVSCSDFEMAIALHFSNFNCHDTNALQVQLTVTSTPQNVCTRASGIQIQVAYIPPELLLISSCS